MKIAVEVGWSDKPGGARRVAFNALRAMEALAPEHEYLLYCNTRQSDLPVAVKQRVLGAPNGIPRVLWDQFLFPHHAVYRQLARDRPDVVLHTNNIMPLIKRFPSVVVIHDMTPFVIPESFHRAHAIYQQAYFRHAAKHADQLLTVSENSKADICNILNVSPGKVVVAPLASDLGQTTPGTDVVDVEHRFGFRGPYVLYVGAIHPRKNVGRILQAYARLKREHNIPHQLVIAGAKRWMQTSTEDRDPLDACADSIVFTGAVADSDIVGLFRGCSAFVYPSLYEGFGLPVLEAMSLGAPVVTSNVSSLPEVAGEAALMVDPLDVNQISQAIMQVIDQPALAKSLREKGLARATTFSWERHATLVLDTLLSAAE